MFYFKYEMLCLVFTCYMLMCLFIKRHPFWAGWFVLIIAELLVQRSEVCKCKTGPHSKF